MVNGRPFDGIRGPWSRNGVSLWQKCRSGTLALSMFRASWQIVREGFAIVMDESLDALTVAKLRTLLGASKAIGSFHDLKTRMGKIPVVDFHVVVTPETTTQEVHNLYVELRNRIREIVGPATTVLMHADPSDDADGSGPHAHP
jgi:divalent metal cation (Fe/Co/Zn/Cd) transporter